MSSAQPIPDGNDCVGGASFLGQAPRELLDGHDGIIFDLDGVIYIGSEPLQGVVESLSILRDRGIAYCFLTNNASRTAQEVAEHLVDLGIPADPTTVLTSAQVAATILSASHPAGAEILVVGGEGLRHALQEQGLQAVGPDEGRPVAVVQGFHPDLTWRVLAAGTFAVRAGLPWIATNLDQTVPTPHGQAPGNGILVGVIEAATGRHPDLVAGKPSPQPFREAATRVGSTRPLVVGDRLETDLQGARAAGMDGLLVLTGVSTATQILRCPPHRRPTYLGRGVDDLFRAHPVAACEVIGSEEEAAPLGYRGRCRDAVVEATAGSLTVVTPGTDALDLLRAGCVAQWMWDDHAPDQGGLPEREASVLTTLRRLDPAATWAR